MNKLVASFFVTVMVAFMSMGFMSSAHAYPDDPPSSDTAPEVFSKSEGAARSTTSATPLPSTGGPNEALLLGGAGLLLVGGASVVVARRQRAH